MFLQKRNKLCKTTAIGRYRYNICHYFKNNYKMRNILFILSAFMLFACKDDDKTGNSIIGE